MIISELNGEELIKYAQSCIEKGNLEESVQVFDELVLRTSSKVAMPLFSRVTCNIQLKKYEEAIADCKLILELPEEKIEEGLVPGCTTLHSAVYSRLNNAYKSLNKLEEAAAALKSRSLIEDKAKRESTKEPLDPKKSCADKKVESLKTKANQLFSEKKFEDAISIYKLALEHDSENAVIHSNLSQTYINIDKLQEAIFHANECIRIKPEWAKGYYRQGVALNKLQDYESAAESLQSALKLAPEDLLITSLLAQVQSKCSSSFFNQQLLTAGLVLASCVCIAYILGLTNFSSIYEFVRSL